jgi:glycosyltransferase involved in cell wall biosynthesis
LPASSRASLRVPGGVAGRQSTAATVRRVTLEGDSSRVGAAAARRDRQARTGEDEPSSMSVTAEGSAGISIHRREGVPVETPHPGDAPQPVTSGAPDVTIVLPCYNEQDHVLQELERISEAMDASEFTYELLVIDDKSTDRTLEVLRAAVPRFPHMRLLPFRRNGGSGTARRIGTQEARGKVVVWTDADMTYPNERIPEFVRYLRENPDVDQVVGARTSEEGTHKWARVPAKWLIRTIASYLSGTKIPDLNSGLRAFRRDVSLPYLRLLPPGFSCVTTITLAFLSNQHPVDYVAIDYAKRSGVSKFHPFRDAYRYILQVLRMIMYFNPLKVLMPLALWLIGIGVAKLVYDVIQYDFHITGSTLLLIFAGFQIGVLALIGDLVVRSRGA